MIFFWIFILLPLAELYVFGLVSSKIGLGTSLLFALFTAVLGGALVRRQGFHVLNSARGSMDRGALPVRELFDGACIFAAGALLVTPGFITDTIGFALLIPPVRGLLYQHIKQSGKWQVDIMSGQNAYHYESRSSGPDVIEGEYETVHEDEKGNP